MLVHWLTIPQTGVPRTRLQLATTRRHLRVIRNRQSPMSSEGFRRIQNIWMAVS